MFEDARKFNGDVSDWDVSSVTNMKDMFNEATKFNCDVSDWDVSSVIYMACYSSCCPKKLPTLSPTVSSPPTPLCIGVRNKFENYYYDDCSIYSGSMLTYCDSDTDMITNNYAQEVCSECGECVDPLIANTSPPTSG